MINRDNKICLYIFLTLVIAFPPQSAYAQVPPQVEKAVAETDRQVSKDVGKKLKTPPKKKPEIIEEKKEEEEEGPVYFIKKITLEGCESFPPEDFRPIVEKYEGREVSFDELNILAKKIRREYLKRGIIADCFVPPQALDDGVVTLRVLEARMGGLKTTAHKFFSRKRIPFYWQIKEGDILRYDRLSRSLQHMNRNPDRELKATLHAGSKPGTTDILLDAKTRFPIHSIFSFDKEGSTYTGIPRTGFGGRHNNFLGLDDTLISGYTFGREFYAIHAYHQVPITGFGTSLLYGYSYSKATPKKDFIPFEIKSMASSASMFLYQDLFRKDEYVGEVFFGFDAKNKRVKQVDITTARDKLRIFRTGGTFLYKHSGSVSYISPEFSQGVNAFGAKRKHFTASRGADNVFSKYKLSLRHMTALPFDLQLSLNLKGQLAPKRLTPQEQFFLGGIDSVRGYPSGDYLADIAFQSNTELLIPAFFIPKWLKVPFAPNPLKDDITGLVFFDYGYGQRIDAIATEQDRVSFMGIGAGLRARIFDQGLLRLEWGFPLGGNEPTTGATDMRLHISISFEDRLFDEIDRIGKILKQKKEARTL